MKSNCSSQSHFSQISYEFSTGPPLSELYWSEKLIFNARVCRFMCCHVWSEPQGNHSESLRLSRGSIQPSTPTLNNSYSSTAASTVGRVQGQVLHAFKNATEKKRKDKSSVSLVLFLKKLDGITLATILWISVALLVSTLSVLFN